MRRRVYKTVRCPSVHLSVRPSIRSSGPFDRSRAATCGGFAAERAGDIDRERRTAVAGRTAAGRSAANAGSVTFTAAVAG